MFLLSIFFNSLLFILFTLMIYSWGKIINYIFKLNLLNFRDRYLNIPLAIISGLYTLSLIFSVFYFFGNINQLNITVVFIFLFLISIPEIINLKRIYFNFSNKKTLYFYFFTSYFLLFIYFLQLALPEIRWDALAYHLLVPDTEVVSFHHSFSFYNSLPKGLDILFWVANIISNNSFLPKYFHFLFFFNCLVFITFFSYNYISKTFFWIPFLVLLLHPISLEYAASSYIDFGNSSLEVIALLCLFLFLIKKEFIFIIWSFSLLAFAVSIKYTTFMFAVSFLIIFILNIFLFKIRTKKFNFNLIKPLLFYSILPLLYLGKNFYFLKNPLWPFYFGHYGMTDLEYQSLTISNLQSFTFDKSLESYFILPIRILTGNYESYSLLTFQDMMENFKIANIDLGLSSILLWILLVVFLFKKIINKKIVTIILLFLIISYSINFWFGSHQIRYILSSFIILSIFPIFLFKDISSLLSKKIIISLAFLFLLLIIFFRISYLQNLFSYFNPNGREQYLLNLHDYDLNILLTENNIKSDQTVYPFELNSLRYFTEFQKLRNAYNLGLGLQKSLNNDIVTLNKNNKKFWISNKMTSNWRKDWLKNPYYEDKIRLNQLIILDDYIIKNGKIISQRGDNLLVEIPINL
jgi:hypothetical protein